jgi:uncharacterized protein YndB with AHSA1/START domain
VRAGRIVALAAVIFVGGVLVLWAIGGSPRQYRAETLIRRPPEHVFAFLVDPRKLPTWIGGLVESRPVTEGGPRRGAKSIDVVEENGRRMEMASEILQFEPGRELEARIENPMCDVISRFQLTPAAEGTRVEQTMTATFKGAYRTFAPFVAGAVQKKLEEDLARLREKAEAAR